jgi:hypothetical protein
LCVAYRDVSLDNLLHLRGGHAIDPASSAPSAAIITPRPASEGQLPTSPEVLRGVPADGAPIGDGAVLWSLTLRRLFRDQDPIRR